MKLSVCLPESSNHPSKVVTPMCNESARSAALCELVVRLVNDSLTEYSYSAYVAELQYGLKATDAGFQVKGFLFLWKCIAIDVVWTLCVVMVMVM